MKVFSLYGKLLKKNVNKVIAYVIAFFAISVLFVSSKPSGGTEFTQTKINAAIINQDGETVLVAGLLDYLNEFISVKNIAENRLADALYYREIYLVLTIPEGFTDDFLAGKDVAIIEENVPDAASNVSVNRAVNNFLNLVSLYRNTIDGESIENIITYVKADLAKKTDVTRSEVYDNSMTSLKTFYNFFSYLFYALIMSVVGIIMGRISKLDIKRRMIVSPYSQARFTFNLLLGHLLFTLAVVAVMVGISFLYFPALMPTRNGLLFAINALCVSLPILGFGYVLALLIRNENALNAAVNVIALGTSFLSGAFIPVFLLGKGVVTFAHILPNYYFIVNNERISYLTDFSFGNLSKIFSYMGIQLLFAVGFVIIALIITRKQSKQEA